jgi:adenine-specific DNA-methyltransferase
MKIQNDEGLGNVVLENDLDRHTKWAKFMFPRIQVMKEMLRDSGVLTICIDDRELFNLGKMCDEVFGEKNRIAIINWQKLGGPQTYTHVSPATEYILVYAKNLEKTKTGLMPRSEEYLNKFKNPDKDPRGTWVVGDPSSQTPTFSMVYAIQNPFTGEIHYPPRGCWTFAKPKMKKFLEGWGSEYQEVDIKDGKSPALLIKGFLTKNLENPIQDLAIQASSKKAYEVLEKGPWPKIIFSHGGKGKPQQKRYLADMKEGHIPIIWWGKEDYENPIELGVVSWDLAQSGTTAVASSEISRSVGRGHGFETAKPLKLLNKLIQLWCPPNGLVLDPFAGSGTTGHAVLQLNKETEAERKFILIERGFNIKEEDKEENNYCRTLLQNRLKAVITGKWADGKQHEPVEAGFRFLKLEKKIDALLLLQMERKEMIDAVIESYGGNTDEDVTKLNSRTNFKYLIAKSRNKEGIYLIWEGKDKENNFTYQTYRQIVEESKNAELRPVFHVYARKNLYQNDNTRFWKIPDQILIDFGVDVKSEPFNE